MATILRTKFSNLFYCIKIVVKISLTAQINNKAVQVPTVAWHRTVDKLLSEAMAVYFTDAYMRHMGPLLLTWVNFNPGMDA